MNNNIVLFRSYLIITFSFLIPLCIFISLELFQLLKVLILLRINSNKISLDKDTFSVLVAFFINRKKWFITISILELFLDVKIIHNLNIYNSLAYCYTTLSYLQIGEYYYLKALSYDSNDINTLANLAALYDLSSNSYKASKIYRRISIIDKNYSIPLNYIDSV